jgi:hypothetical protein
MTIGMRGKVLKRPASVATWPHRHSSERDLVPPCPPVAARATIESDVPDAPTTTADRRAPTVGTRRSRPLLTTLETP